MIQRIRFGTVEALASHRLMPCKAEETYICREGLATPEDCVMGFTGYMNQIPAHEDFSTALALCGLRWSYLEHGFRHIPAEDVQQSANFVKIEGAKYNRLGESGRIFQLAHNVLAIAQQMPIGGAEEMIEFIDLSGALPTGRNAFHA